MYLLDKPSLKKQVNLGLSDTWLKILIDIQLAERNSIKLVIVVNIIEHTRLGKKLSTIL